MTQEEVQVSVQQSRDTIVQILVSDYKKTDMTPIARQMAQGELIEAYVSALNMEADFLGQGGSYSSDEYKEIRTMKQNCEHWIAQRVLELSGWKGINVTRYCKKDG